MEVCVSALAVLTWAVVAACHFATAQAGHRSPSLRRRVSTGAGRLVTNLRASGHQPEEVAKMAAQGFASGATALELTPTPARIRE
jgi:hypothetical protein